MKGVVLWVVGASVAFLATASAFLLLANLGSEGEASNDPIPRAEPSAESPKPTLVLVLPEERLEGLQKGPGQRLALDVENAGDEEFSSVDLELDVASENTALPRARYYRQAARSLAPAETTTVEFEVDLSMPATGYGTKAEEQVRQILEIRATTPEGDSAVKSAVLAP